MGANLSGGVPANTGKGALIAVAVVPDGEAVGISGNIGGEVGSAFAFPAIVAPFPEPASVGLLSLALAAVTVRRRRYPASSN